MTGYRIPTDIYVTDFDPTDALCAQTDPELFFPEQGDHLSAKYAKQICSKCPLIQDCLEEAVTKDYTDGIWGGTSPHERREIAYGIERRPSHAQFLMAQAIAKLHGAIEQEEKRKEAWRKSENERRKRSKMAGGAR